MMKIALRTELHEICYQLSLDKLEERLMDLIRRNCNRMGHVWPVFSYKGTLHIEKGLVIDPKMKAKDKYYVLNQRLDPTLHAEMDKWLNYQQTLKSESQLVTSTLTSVLNSTSHVGDYLTMLPDLLHDRLNEVSERCTCTTVPMTQERRQQVLSTQGRYINLIRERQVLYLFDDFVMSSSP